MMDDDAVADLICRLTDAVERIAEAVERIAEAVDRESGDEA